MSPQFAFCVLSLLPSVALSYHTHVLFTNRASPAVRRAVTPTLRGVNPNSPEEDADARARLERMFAAEPAPEPTADSAAEPAADAAPEPTTDAAPTTPAEPAPPAAAAAAPPNAEPADPEPVEVGVLLDLPLWRVGWVAMPGSQLVAKVTAPHYVHLFRQLASASASAGTPARFGHLYLPNASRSLGKPEYELLPGSLAAKVGTLMEVSDVRDLQDGRVVVVAHAVGRFRVLRQVGPAQLRAQ